MTRKPKIPTESDLFDLWKAIDGLSSAVLDLRARASASEYVLRLVLQDIERRHPGYLENVSGIQHMDFAHLVPEHDGPEREEMMRFFRYVDIAFDLASPPTLAPEAPTEAAGRASNAYPLPTQPENDNDAPKASEGPEGPSTRH